MTRVDPLDNPFWHAMQGPQRERSLGNGLARRYLPDLASQAALSSPTDAAYAALAAVVDDGDAVDVFLDAPHRERLGWEAVFEVELQQMVCTGLIATAPSPYVELGEADASDVLELAEATRPGPLRRGALALGRFVGIRDGGRLVAMAGERARLESHQEISGVCTLPAYRGRGYARALVHELAASRLRRGQTPFLHVELGNLNAIRLYEAMGFIVRRRFHVAVLRRADGS